MRVRLKGVFSHQQRPVAWVSQFERRMITMGRPRRLWPVLIEWRKEMVNLMCALIIVLVTAHGYVWGIPAVTKVGEYQTEEICNKAGSILDEKPISGVNVYHYCIPVSAH